MEVPAQAKLKSAAHWQVVASDVSSQMQKSFGQLDAAQRRVWVPDVAGPRSKFEKVFPAQLRSGLAGAGVSLVDRPDAAYEVSIKVESVRHGESRRSGYRPGTLTALTAGVLVGRDIDLHAPTSNPSIMAVAIAADIVSAVAQMKPRPTSTELVISTSAKKDGVFLMHRSDVYYIDEIDAALFEPPPDAPLDAVGRREFKVVGRK